ncbi:MAG: hypothetical protein R3F59_25350 [Myxococcota bacterium]
MSLSRHRLVGAALIAVALMTGGSKLSRLSDAEYAHYRALRVFMDDGQRKDYLKLKDPTERDQFLKDAGLWDKFYGLTDEQRQRVVDADVDLGFTRDMVYMAWGVPFERQRLTGREAQRSELFVYRFEIAKDGSAATVVGKHVDYKAVGQHQVELVVDDDIVTERKEKDHWE